MNNQIIADSLSANQLIDESTDHSQSSGRLKK